MTKTKMGEDGDYIYYLMENGNMVSTASKNKKTGHLKHNVALPSGIVTNFTRLNSYPSRASELHRKAMELKRASFYNEIVERGRTWEVLSAELETLKASINADLAVDQSRDVYANLMAANRLCNQAQRELTDVACSIIYTFLPELNPNNGVPKEVINEEHSKKVKERIAKLDDLLGTILNQWKSLPAPINEGVLFNCMATISGLWDQVSELRNGVMSVTVMNEFPNEYAGIITKYTRLVAMTCARSNANTRAKHSYTQIAAYMKGEITLDEWKLHTHTVD